jgi:sialidase-1
MKLTLLTALLLLALIFAFPADGAPPRATILETKTISWQPDLYHGWPTVARRQNGELWLAWSGGRESHVCPFGQVCAMTSRDDGKTWTFPRVLLDSASDDRDSGVLETAKGTLLVTTFVSIDDHHFKKAIDLARYDGTRWVKEPLSPGRLARWKAAFDRLNDDERKADQGEWMIRSTDGGRTWSPRLPTVVNSPHGPIKLKDGRVLYLGKQLFTAEQKIGAVESRDDGLTWQWLADIPTRPGDDATKSYHELHGVEAADGTIIAQIRNEYGAHAGETLQTESKDGGKTWTVPHPIGVWGLPSHLLRLRDGRLLMTYGHRRQPFGNQARFSADHGRTWSEPVAVSADASTADLGYPSTVELGDDTLLTVWYEALKDQPRAVLRQARWRLE